MIGESQPRSNFWRVLHQLRIHALKQSDPVSVTATAKIEAAIHSGLTTDHAILAKRLTFTVSQYHVTKAVVKVA